MVWAEDTAIDPGQAWGTHIMLRCRNHPTLRWHTKNIGYIGARTIFFAGEDAPREVRRKPDSGNTFTGTVRQWLRGDLELWDRASRSYKVVPVDSDGLMELARFNREYEKMYVRECDCAVADLEVVPLVPEEETEARAERIAVAEAGRASAETGSP